jgi:hypothetical protein
LLLERVRAGDKPRLHPLAFKAQFLWIAVKEGNYMKDSREWICIVRDLLCVVIGSFILGSEFGWKTGLGIGLIAYAMLPPSSKD